ncbi:MAG TPA: OmpH family outer membrane protein [Rhizomicrobium sp.]|jgi:Skp family chaperone for outer membrane proteins|nr:OmpH family outer membrane protein [Rhizomicrobium sp.]
MKNSLIICRSFAVAMVAAALLSVGAASAAPPPPAKPGGAPAGAVPAPKILVIDRNVIIRVSKAGQDIVKQASNYMASAQKEFRAEGEGLQKEGRALQQQVAILAPDVKAKKIRDFQAKQAAFERKVEARQGLIQGGVFKARQQMEQALGPILQGIMQERGANLLFDRSSIVLGTVNIDITGAAVQRLDQKLPSVKVQLIALPANVQAQLAQQAQAQRR